MGSRLKPPIHNSTQNTAYLHHPRSMAHEDYSPRALPNITGRSGSSTSLFTERFVANNPLHTCCPRIEINRPLPEGMASAMPPHQPFIRWRMSEDAHPYPQQPIFPVSKVGRTVPVSRLFSPFVVKKDKELYSPRRNEGPRRKICHHSLQPLWSLCALWQIILFRAAAPDKKSTVLFRRGWLQPSSFAIPHQPFIRWRMSEDAHPYPQQPIFPVSKAGRGVPTEPLFSPFSCIP